MPDRGWFEATFERGPMGALLLDPDGRIERANPAFRELLGVEEDPVGRKLADLLTSGHERLEEGRSRAQGEERSRSLHGFRLEALGRKRRHVVDVDFYPQSNESGGVTGVLLVFHDRTGVYQDPAASARLFHQAFLNSTNAMELTDRDGFLIDVNPAFERIYGYRRDEVIGQRPNLVASGRTDPAAYTQMWKDLLDPRLGSWSGELINRDRAAVEHPVLITITAIRGDDGVITHFLGVAVDLTELRRLERQALHSDRLVSLGQLAAGVAHEINTPLANIMLIAESVRRRTTDSWTRGRVDSLLHQTESAARIVRGLLDFARRPEAKVGEVDLGDSLRAVTSFLKGKQSAAVEVAVALPDEPLIVRGDRDQINQVITNLLNNAYDALNGQGRIDIRLTADPEWVHLSVADNGAGIPPDARAHLFEPFFTTKPEGKGTGLGLAICIGIVESHGGTIEVASEVGKGSTFLVHLPRLTANTVGPPTESRP
ncbi:MAG TPA: ATP-binding protein [Thermoplasmata archaeon]|jgi:PAS domain S-box-containing protein